ncbi:MAG: RluA family pseudouridine synthase [Candidatus Omnitrophota bacterium]
MHELRVASEDNGKRMDNVTTKYMVRERPELEISRTLIQGMIEKGEVLLNKKFVKPGHKVKPDDRIEIDLEKLEKETFIEHDKRIPKAEKVSLDIIYEDDDILIVNKPAGMVTHPACGHYSGTLVNALLNYPGFLTKFNEPGATNACPPKSAKGGRRQDEQRIMRPGIVHRLDKDTSGIMIVAKKGRALRRIASQLKNKTITKKYIAIVRGIVGLDEGVINAPISHDRRNRRKMAIDEENGKEAITYYRVIKRDKEKNITILEARPKTGRTHQIRIHLSSIGHPILGDTLYNGPVVNGLSRHALHARSIAFIHPTKNTPMEFSADIPSDLKGLTD